MVMMTDLGEHDVMCGCRTAGCLHPPGSLDCHCSLIAKAREDQNERIAQAIERHPGLVGRQTAARIARNGGSDQ